MQTLHRLAGVQDASDLSTAQPDRSRPSNFPEPPPIPESDTYSQQAGSETSLSRHASRASLPIKKSSSRKSLTSKPKPAPPQQPTTAANTPTDITQQPPTSPTTVETSSEEDFEWGPSHPCFPHPNPHCAPDSDQHKSTRVIRVKRDWLASGDLCPQYANLYPEILDPLVSDGEFREVIGKVNGLLRGMFDPFASGKEGADGKGWNWRAVGDVLLGGVTGWVWDDLGFTGTKRGMRELEGLVDGWNESKRRKGRDVRIVQLRRTGFMTLDFVIPDPGLDGVAVVEEQS